MRAQNINFSDQQVTCVFPEKLADLGQALSELHLIGSHPVIVLIGGEIDEKQADVTRRAIQTLSRIVEELHALVICQGTDMGIMAEIGLARSKSAFTFPLVGIAPEELVTWADGPASAKKSWWGKKQRWQLAASLHPFHPCTRQPVRRRVAMDRRCSDPFIQRWQFCDCSAQRRRSFKEGCRIELKKRPPGDRFESYRAPGRRTFKRACPKSNDLDRTGGC